MFATNENSRLKTVQQKMVRGESKKKSQSEMKGVALKQGKATHLEWKQPINIT